MKTKPFIIAVIASMFLFACGEEEKIGVSYLGLNHTDRSIVSVIVNGEGGVLDVSAHGGGGKIVCCVMLPKKWKPGLTATIKWEEDGDWLLDANGKEVIRNGKRVYVPAPWKERTVEIPRYDAVAEFYIVFFPKDEITVAVSNGIPDLAETPR